MIVAALATTDVKSIERAVRAARRFLASEGRLPIELKFHHCSERLRMSLLEGLSRTRPQIAWSGLDKLEHPDMFADDKEKLVESLSGCVVGAVARRMRTKSFTLVTDRRWTKERRRTEFNSRMMQAVATQHSGYFVPSLEVSHFDSTACPGLQAVDFVAGAVFRNLERGDESYLSIVEDCILHGELL